MPVSQTQLPGIYNAGRQNSVYQNNFWNGYTGTTIPTNSAFFVTDGLNGVIMVEIVENNVAGGASLIMEGSMDNANWYAMGFYPVVTAGTTQTTLTRSQGTQAISQNSRYVWQVADAYPYLRARLTANASSASLNLTIYGMSQ